MQKLFDKWFLPDTYKQSNHIIVSKEGQNLDKYLWLRKNFIFKILINFIFKGYMASYLIIYLPTFLYLIKILNNDFWIIRYKKQHKSLQNNCNNYCDISDISIFWEVKKPLLVGKTSCGIISSNFLDRHPMAVSWFHPGHLFTFCEAISHLFFLPKILSGKFHEKFVRKISCS